MTNIYVGNLSFNATETQLREAFSRYGEVSSVNIIKDRETNRSRGFAFVEMMNAHEARAAISGLHQSSIGDRAISCNEAREREDRSSRNSGGNYSSRGDGRGRDSRRSSY